MEIFSRDAVVQAGAGSIAPFLRIRPTAKRRCHVRVNDAGRPLQHLQAHSRYPFARALPPFYTYPSRTSPVTASDDVVTRVTMPPMSTSSGAKVLATGGVYLAARQSHDSGRTCCRTQLLIHHSVPRHRDLLTDTMQCWW